MKKCKVCDNKTNSYINIDFKKVAICEDCATTIFLQQGLWIANMYTKQLKEGDAFRGVIEIKDKGA